MVMICVILGEGIFNIEEIWIPISTYTIYIYIYILWEHRNSWESKVLLSYVVAESRMFFSWVELEGAGRD